VSGGRLTVWQRGIRPPADLAGGLYQFAFRVPGYLVAPIYLNLQARRILGQTWTDNQGNVLRVERVDVVRPLSSFMWNKTDVVVLARVEGIAWYAIAAGLLALGVLGAGLAWGMLAEVHRIIETPAGAVSFALSTALVVGAGLLLLWVAFRSGLLSELGAAGGRAAAGLNPSGG
jgi:hypothetical protein